ncbi:hypothetical protein LO762_07825 [Actinocorallia sp. API 0066]|uniref:hypothetical protein n=1 Tax=Actinocorallia sp. API 0066 TaxID=2896846 RepID=UPI001E400590|nr:hypothetical protein [Actinocorallia sp. API 0066]MCD0449097.1 hypothetical protein [Actinocorallia sp. API 0066]
MTNRHWPEAVDSQVAEARRALLILHHTAEAAGTDMGEVLAFGREGWPPGTADAYDVFQEARMRLTVALARADGKDFDRLSAREAAPYLLTAMALAL